MSILKLIKYKKLLGAILLMFVSVYATADICLYNVSAARLKGCIGDDSTDCQTAQGGGQRGDWPYANGQVLNVYYWYWWFGTKYKYVCNNHNKPLQNGDTLRVWGSIGAFHCDVYSNKQSGSGTAVPVKCPMTPISQ